ncbi:hypothetical protein FHS23_003614 [Prauserella isguenensis]|uniref:Uncharacterized protein n=1 Tax=Prauserella isguenensis TaxID=1470180 RepID=A0A839S6F4_9PSEU|nr:hypothetical protein [Prauserella isguenensis]
MVGGQAYDEHADQSFDPDGIGDMGMGAEG